MAVKPKFVYYPSKFQLENFCSKYKLPAYKVAGILQLFIFKPNDNEGLREISLSSKLLRKNFGDIYRNILECLIIDGIIENTVGYYEGSARKFQLTDVYQFSKGTNKYIREPFTLNEGLAHLNEKKISEKYLEELKLPKIKRTSEIPTSIFLDRYSHLIKWLTDGKLSLNIERALKIINEGNIQGYDANKYLEYIAIIDVFKEKDYYIKSDKNFRFYSSLTNLPKLLRGCLTYDGKKLAGTDVSNTQPLFLGTLCDKFFLTRLKKEQNIEVNDTLFNEFINHLDTLPTDLKIYNHLVQNGILYESFSDISPEFSRDIIKDNLIKVINDKGIDKNRYKVAIRKALKERFPTISLLLNLLKSKNHKYVSSTLMSIEAQNFVINFPHEFYYKEEHRNIPLFMIHDCFFTTEENINYVENCIKNYYSKFLSINLHMKRETLK